MRIELKRVQLLRNRIKYMYKYIGNYLCKFCNCNFLRLKKYVYRKDEVFFSIHWKSVKKRVQDINKNGSQMINKIIFERGTVTGLLGSIFRITEIPIGDKAWLRCARET